MNMNANSIRAGNILRYKNDLWVVSKTPMHTMPGKGGAFVQVEMKNVKSGTKLNERFRSNEDVERVYLDDRAYQYLYRDDDVVTLMDNESFEQLTVPNELFGERLPFLQDGMVVKIESFEEKPISAHLPEHVILKIVEAEAVIKGQTATSSFKPALLENGVRVMVPPFVEADTMVIVRTEDATYVKRAE